MLYGGDRTDGFYGGGGADRLFGGGGDDAIYATGALGSLLEGGAGNDFLLGGQGAKTGYAAGRDQIDLSAIAAGQHFIDGAEFGHVAGEVRFEGATHLLQGDLHGEGAADYEVLLDALPVLTTGDLILSAIRSKCDHVPATHPFNFC